MNLMELIKSDLSRYRSVNTNKIDLSEPSLYVILLYRIGKSLRDNNSKLLNNILNIPFLLLYIPLSVITGIHIPRGATIGPGIRIYHYGCIIVNPLSVIGKNCTIRHGVTIGNRHADDDVPVIGDNVVIGAGAKILGNIKIGDNVHIGANAVVLYDVPDNNIAVGIPAKNSQRKS